MKRYLLTGPSYTGAVVLIYDEEGFMVCLDTLQTNLKGNKAAWLFRNLPTNFNGNDHSPSLEKFIEGKDGVRVVQEDLPITFTMFWDKYGKKINKKRCETMWDKMPKEKQVAAYYGVWAYDRFLLKLDWKRTKSDPEGYLTKEMWENEWE